MGINVCLKCSHLGRSINFCNDHCPSGKRLKNKKRHKDWTNPGQALQLEIAKLEVDLSLLKQRFHDGK